MSPELLEIRLQSVRDAASRARLAFLTIIVASLALMTASWNAHGSWYRTFLRPRDFADSPVTKLAQEELVRQWVRSQWISLGPLGLQAGVSDAAVLASFGIAIIALWLFFAVRRENHEIGRLLADAHLHRDIDLSQRVLHGVTGSLVFIGISGDDTPYASLTQQPRPSPETGLRWFLSVLFMLPALAIFTAILVDVASIFILDAMLRPNHEPLLWRIATGPPTMLLKLGLMMALSAVLGVFTYVACRKVVLFEDATTAVIREFALSLETLEKDDPRVHEIPRVAPSAPSLLRREFSLTDWMKIFRAPGSQRKEPRR